MYILHQRFLRSNLANFFIFIFISCLLWNSKLNKGQEKILGLKVLISLFKWDGMLFHHKNIDPYTGFPFASKSMKIPYKIIQVKAMSWWKSLADVLNPSIISLKSPYEVKLSLSAFSR